MILYAVLKIYAMSICWSQVKGYPKRTAMLRTFKTNRPAHHLGIALHDVESQAGTRRTVRCIAGPKEAIEAPSGIKWGALSTTKATTKAPSEFLNGLKLTSTGNSELYRVTLRFHNQKVVPPPG